MELLILNLKHFALIYQWLNRFVEETLNARRRNKNLDSGENLGIRIWLSCAADAGMDVALVAIRFYEDANHQAINFRLEP